MKKLLEGGECIRYGAKTMPVGGWFSFPKLYGDGFMLIGDSAGTCNGERLKGVHLAIKSGMLAAETLVEAIRKDDYSEATLASYKTRWDASWLAKEHYKARNFHALVQVRAEVAALARLAAPAALADQRPGARDDHRRARAREDGARAPGSRAHEEALRADAQGAEEEGKGRLRQQVHLRQGDRGGAGRLAARGRPAAPPARRRHERVRDQVRRPSTATPARASARPRCTR